jgi:hypothetical protein
LTVFTAREDSSSALFDGEAHPPSVERALSLFFAFSP